MSSNKDEPIQLTDDDHVPPSDAELLANAIPIDADDEDEKVQTDEQSLPKMDLVAPDPKHVSKIRTTERQRHSDKWNRTPNLTGHGAIHVKTFVAKLRPDAIDFLDSQINEWLDANPEYEVKFVTSNVGEMMGKLREPCLFVNVWV